MAGSREAGPDPNQQGGRGVVVLGQGLGLAWVGGGRSRPSMAEGVQKWAWANMAVVEKEEDRPGHDAKGVGEG